MRISHWVLAVVWVCLACQDRSPPAATPVAAPRASDAWKVTATSAGPVRIGMSGNDARATLGMPTRSPDTMRDQCEFMAAPGPRVEFMLYDDTVVRVDIADSSVRTVGGAGIGDSEASLRSLFGPAITAAPTKYGDGNDMTVRMDADTLSRIIFETEQGRVVRYRAGRAPYVGYVERCG